MTDKQLVEELIQAAYDSGYYSGLDEHGQPHHLKAIKRRNTLRENLLIRLEARAAASRR